MKRSITHSVSRRGSALFTVMGLTFVICLLLGTMSTVSVQRAFMGRKLTDRVRALLYAEAGINDAYNLIESNWAARTNANLFPLTSYGMGSYDVTVVPLTNNVALLRSVGRCNDTAVEVIVDVKNHGDGGDAWSSEAFNYAMVCGGLFDYGGSGILDNGEAPGVAVKFHSNSILDIFGSVGNVNLTSSTEVEISNNVAVDGDVTAPELDYTPSKVTITGVATEEAVPYIEIPDIDLTPYYIWAKAHGEVRSGFSLSGGTYTPAGGILWVNGTVQISSSSTINGAIIATGDISFGGSSSLTTVVSGFALASRDGNIKNTSSGPIEGLIYVKNGSYEQTANGTLTGQIIANGSIKKTGTSDALIFRKIVPTLPGWTPQSELIGISAWQK